MPTTCNGLASTYINGNGIPNASGIWACDIYIAGYWVILNNQHVTTHWQNDYMSCVTCLLQVRLL